MGTERERDKRREQEGVMKMERKKLKETEAERSEKMKERRGQREK